MAGDWIKIEMTTPDKPEVSGIAERLRIDPDMVVGKLLRIWVWADQNSLAGDNIHVSDQFLDRLAHKRGFAAAMRSVGWLTGENGALTFPGFERHNGHTAKMRAESNRRMIKTRVLRKGCGDVAENPQQKAQPEKRREEILPPLSPQGGGVGEEGILLIAKIKSLRPRWQASPLLSSKETRLFKKNEAVVALFEAADWETLRVFLAAKLPEGSALFQPVMLEKFLENPGATLGDAREWQKKQRPRVIAPIDDQRTPEDHAALAEFLGIRTKQAS